MHSTEVLPAVISSRSEYNADTIRPSSTDAASLVAILEDPCHSVAITGARILKTYSTVRRDSHRES